MNKDEIRGQGDVGWQRRERWRGEREEEKRRRKREMKGDEERERGER